MKTFFRLTAVFLVCAILLLANACNNKGGVEAVNAELAFLPLTSDGDGMLAYNPDRGFRSGAGFSLGSLAKLSSEEKIKEAVYKTLDNYVFKLTDNTKVINLGYGLTEFNKTEKLPDNLLLAIRVVCDILRQKGYKQSVNFVYNSSYHVAWTTSEEARKNIESVCASEEIMLSHIEQLAPVLSEYKDTIFSIMGGFIGFSGDMAESSQYPSVDRNKIMKAVIDKLVLPNDVYYLIRVPEHKFEFEKANPGYEGNSKISFVNKSMFGEQTKLGWNSGGYQKGNPEKTAIDWWEYVTENAFYAPNDGEVFPNSNLIGKQSYPSPRIMSGREIILECAHHGMTTMGVLNGYYEVNRANESPAVMDLWKQEEITPAILYELKIVYDHAFFLDDEGNTVWRNTFQFIREHLGYKLSAAAGSIGIDNEKVSVSLLLKNYGFSAA
ncbi:MAG: DUF4874 domain-containing protein, partial [Clostridia bacterium]|nr:DUF4874 domain-containing protein [Clostridia bacterium]